MRTTNQTSPTLRIRREALRQMTVADRRIVAGGTTKGNATIGGG